MKLTLYLVIALVLSAAPAKAWNGVGHRIVAEIAWRKLDAKERAGVSELLRQHPHYKLFLAADVPSGVSTNEWTFLTAAVWPDWVRRGKTTRPPEPESVTKYDLYPHALGHPFLRAGDTNRALLENFFVAKPDAEMVLSNSIAALKNPEIGPPERAVSLCWVLHLMGDLHQPLHAANRVTAKKPGGEGLGGSFIVRKPNGEQINLHAFWDQLPGLDGSYKAIEASAARLAAAANLQPARLKEYQQDGTVPAWVQESFRDAVAFAYAEDKLEYVNEQDLKSGKVRASAVPKLRAEYVAGAKEIADRRVVLAGQRLADALKQVW